MSRLLQSRTFLAILAISLGAFLLGITFWHLHDTDPMWAIISFVLVYDPDMRAALAAGVSRLWHTLLGTALALGLISIFGLHKWLMPLSLAIAALVCGGVLHFHNSWRVVLVTVALIVGSSLLQPSEGLQIALTRAFEVSAGSLLAIAFSGLVARLVTGNSAVRPRGSHTVTLRRSRHPTDRRGSPKIPVEKSSGITQNTSRKVE